MGHLKLAPPFNVVVSPKFAQSRARPAARERGGLPQDPRAQSGSPQDPREQSGSARDAEDARLAELAQRFAPDAQIMEDAAPSPAGALNSPFGAFKALPPALQTLILALVLIALLPSLTLTAFIWLGPLDAPALALAEGPDAAGKTSAGRTVKTASLADLPLVAGESAPAAGAPLPADGARLASPPALEGHAGQDVPFAIALASVEPLPPRSVIAVSGLPAGAALSAGRPYTDSEWNLRPEELAALRLALPETAQGETVLRIALIDTGGETLAETKTALKVIALPANAPGEPAQAALSLAAVYDPFTVPAIGDTAALAGAVPTTQASEGPVPEGLAPETQVPEGLAPATQASETLTSETQAAETEPAGAQAAAAEAATEEEPGVGEASPPANGPAASEATSGPFANSAAKPEPSVALSAFVNLRARPTSSSPVIAVMAKGTAVTPTAKTRGWLRVTDAASGKTGWIYGRYAGGTAQVSAQAAPSRLGPSSEESWLTRFGRWVVY